MQEFYDITVAGVKRSLPIVPISDTMSIAGFVIFGDTEVVEPCARALAEKLRTPLLLRYMEGFTEKEIAQALGVSLPTVKSRLHRARRALREELGDSEVTFE